MSNVAERIKNYNKGRIPELLEHKYKLMREDKYKFYRGIPHVLYADVPKNSFIYDSPPVWLCGDLHLENLGSYKGDNRLTYFGVNDFDECILGSFFIDISRLLTSILVSADNLKLGANEARDLCNVFVNKYFDMLAEGYIRELEMETTRGVMRDFLKQVAKRKRKDFIRKKIEKKKGSKHLLIDNVHTLQIPKAEKEKVKQHIDRWAKHMENPEFYKVLDVVFRIAGTSSLGLNRYALLVEGRGGDAGHFLLDLKQTIPSCLGPHINIKQPKWKTEADRLVEVQRRTLTAPPALLASINIDKTNFVLKELLPVADRINYTVFAGNTKKLKNILEDLGSICAWSNLRGAGRDSSAIADELIHFARNNKAIKKQLIDDAYHTLKKTIAYYKEYCEAYDKGYFKVK